MDIIKVQNLVKIYNQGFRQEKVPALQGVSLSISPGLIYGLLGPNGAGKTTLIKILLGITFPTSGDAEILNSSISDYRIRKKIGYLPENHKFPPFLTAEEILKFFGKLSGVESNLDQKINNSLELVKMLKWKKSKIKSFSKGMMQRLGLAQSMLHDPEILFLDEPTDGVDPLGRKEIRDILQLLKNEGKTIFINSHLLSEVEMISDRVAIMDKGLLVREGTVDELTTEKEIYEFEIANAPEVKKLSELLLTEVKNISPGKYKIKSSNIEELNSFIDKLRKENYIIQSLKPVKTSLEDMFISIIKEGGNNE